MRFRPAGLLLASTLGLLGGCARGPEPTQIVLFAIDGMEPHVLEAMLEAEELPNIQRLIDRGSLGRIKCVTDLLSPVVWTTVATGTSPQEHGIVGFEIDGIPVRPSDRQRPAFWNLLPSLGVPTATVGWMVTWPAEDDSGLMVSDRAHYGNFERKISPSDFLDLEGRLVKPRSTEGLKRFTSFPYNPRYEVLDRDDPTFPTNFLVDRRLNRIFQRDGVYFRIARDILDRNDLEVLALYLRGIDYVSHGFWQFYEPEPFRRAGWKIHPKDVEHLQSVIPAYYRWIDDVIGMTLRSARREATVVLLSDHGFGTALGQYAIPRGDFLSGNHRPSGVLVLSGAGVQRGVRQTRQITHYDILPTLLWMTGKPQASDFRGRPLVEYLTERFSASDSVPPVPTYRDFLLSGTQEIEATEEDEEILEELRSLGYIE